MKYIYGPVKSRRLGFSLGISLTPYKICSFDCVYCQLGKTTQKISQRQEYIPVRDILDEFKSWVDNNPQDLASLSYVTLSGSGEPTLNSGIASLISGIKQVSRVPVALITNSSLLTTKELRQEILQVDLIVPSLDAVRQDIFEKIDLPQPGIKIEEIIQGLIDLRHEFRGKIWLEVMLIKGLNDDLRHIKKIKEAADKINPDKIQLNSPVRTSPSAGLKPVALNKLKKIQEIFGDKCEIL